MHAPKIPWALLLSASLSPGLFAQGARKEQDVSPEVRRLTFKGVDHVDINELAQSLSTRASKCKSLVLKPFCLVSHSPTFYDKFYLDRDELRRDMLRTRLFYWKRGYRETDVDTTVTPTGTNQVAVTFDVKEWPPTVIRSIAVDRDTSLINNRTLGRVMLLQPKDPLDLIVLDSMRVLLQNELWDRGYGDGVADTTVVVDTATRLADVQIKLIPNRVTTVGKITVAGNDRIDETTIRNTITFKTVDLYKHSEIL